MWTYALHTCIPVPCVQSQRISPTHKHHTPSSACAQLIHMYFSIIFVIILTKIYANMFSWVTVLEFTKLWWCKYSCYHMLDLSPNCPISNANDAWSKIWTITSQDADNAITMHNVCKNNVKHHRGTLWHDKGQSVAERDVSTARLQGPNVTLACRLVLKLSFSHIQYLQLHMILPANISMLRIVYQRWCTSTSSSTTMANCYNCSPSLNNLRHYRLHWFLIATGGTTAI